LNSIFNHDGFGLLAELAGTGGTPADADRVLVAPLAAAGFNAIDWCICSTGIHNCRTRHGRGITRELLACSHTDNPAMWGEAAASTIFPIGDVVERYNTQDQDLLDCVVAAGHARGLRVYGNVRLNHACVPRWLAGIPGASHAGDLRRDFRDDAFQAYLLELYEDLLAKGVDGLSLDFERKAPFFPDGVPQGERFAACARFLRAVRALTAKPLIARVAYQPEKGEPQGQEPLAWMTEGLLDAVIPATHNHEPDPFDWLPEAFFAAAKRSPRPCAVWPQLWPTPEPWNAGHNRRHAAEAVRQRCDALKAAGADGAYFFNFCCYGPPTWSAQSMGKRSDHEPAGKDLCL
jgi:hypothetical protein